MGDCSEVIKEFPELYRSSDGSKIVESRLIPVGDIFFRASILPEEKRRLIIRGLIPREIVEARLADAKISEQERYVLEDQLKLLDA